MKPLLTTIILSFLILPLITLAQYQPPISEDGVITGTKNGLVPCEGAGCSTCDLVVLANTGIKTLLALSFLFFAILAVKAGVGLVVSQGNPGALTKAKESFTNAFIGLIIILVAFLIVDTLLRQILRGGTGDVNGYGPWAKVQCAEQVEPGLKAGFFGGDPEFVPGDAAVESSTFGTMTADPNADGALSYQGGISQQRVHASAPLERMLSCIGKTVPPNVGQISSISDTRIISGTKTWAQCRLGGKNVCGHVENSFHYGSTGKCGDKSYAVDFGDELNVKIICAAANSCGSVASCSVHNGNHVHLSIPITCN
jgi:hypothetical protein